MTGSKRLRVVIIGSGFGGLWALRALAHSDTEVLVIDSNDYHTFFPLLYQVAAAEIEPEEIVFPIRKLIRQQQNAQFLMEEVRTVDLEAHLVKTHTKVIPYDYLILALGSTSYFFGLPGAAEHAFPLRTMEQGIALRNHILQCFEQATYEPDPIKRHRLLTFVIVGAGPTGVEFAGALAELVYGPLKEDYRGLDPHEVRIVLLEAMDRLLPGLHAKLGQYAQKRLQKMGVDVHVEAPVREIAEGVILLKDSTSISEETVVWTAGVRGVRQIETWGLPTAKNGRIEVTPTLQVLDHPEVYVVGDLALLPDEQRKLPMVAPVAIQQGTAAAQNIIRQINGQKPNPFRYRNRGVLVTVGRNSAVADIFGHTFTGSFAWILWVSVHLFNLIGFRNRLFVLIDWAWDYFFYDRAVRIVLPKTIVSPHNSIREISQAKFVTQADNLPSS